MQRRVLYIFGLGYKDRRDRLPDSYVDHCLYHMQGKQGAVRQQQELRGPVLLCHKQLLLVPRSR